jgi:hypothetical protein
MGRLVKSQTPELVAAVVLEPGTAPFPIRHKLSRRRKNRFATTHGVNVYSTARSGTYLEPLGAPDCTI